MNLSATVALYSGGVGSGCQGENCGRPATGDHHWHPPGEFLRLDLKQPHGYPIMFQNDEKLKWAWSADHSHLLVEEENADENKGAIGMSMKTVYSIPEENISYWGFEHEKEEKTVGGSGGPRDYVMDMEDR